MPMDIMSRSVRHVVIVAVLLPKDHRVKRNMLGIELALKLTLQTEWSAAADLVGAYASKKAKQGEEQAWVKAIKRPIFIAPCGGQRMQLLSQISKGTFTLYPSTSLDTALSNAMNTESATNFIQRVGVTASVKSGQMSIERSIESKRKREIYLEDVRDWLDQDFNVLYTSVALKTSLDVDPSK